MSLRGRELTHSGFAKVEQLRCFAALSMTLVAGSDMDGGDSTLAGVTWMAGRSLEAGDAIVSH